MGIYQIQHWFNQKYYLIIFHFSHVGRGVVFIMLCCFVYQSDFSNLHVYIIEEPFLYFENTTAVPIKPKYAHVLWNEKNKTSSKIYKSRDFGVFLTPIFLICLKRWFSFQSWITVLSGKYSMFKVYSVLQLNQRWENSVLCSLLRTRISLKDLKRRHVRLLLSQSSTRTFFERKKRNPSRYWCFYCNVFVNFWLYLLHVKRIVIFTHSFIHSIIHSIAHSYVMHWLGTKGKLRP